MVMKASTPRYLSHRRISKVAQGMHHIRNMIFSLFNHFSIDFGSTLIADNILNSYLFSKYFLVTLLEIFIFINILKTFCREMRCQR